MSSRMLAAAAATALVLGGASLAQAQTYTTVDLSPYVNQSFTNTNWYIDGGQFQNDLAGQTTLGNQGSNVPFAVANTGAQNNFWYGLNEDGFNLFASDPNNPNLNTFTIAVAATGITDVFTLANNTFGRPGALEYTVTFQGTGGSITDDYIGGSNTRDYNTPNCNTTGCTNPTGSTDWYNDGSNIVLAEVDWTLPQNFGLTAITFNQVDNFDGAILAGVTLGTPEPATWGLMLMGFGLAGATLRRRRAALAAA